MTVATQVREMTLGEWVSQRRRRLGLTQKKVTDRMDGRDPTWLSRIERGIRQDLPKPDELTMLAKALETNEAELLRAYGYQLSDDEPRPVDDPWEVSDLESVARGLRSLLAAIESRKGL